MRNHFLSGFASELTKVAVSKKWIASKVKSGILKSMQRPGGKARVAKFEKKMEKAKKKASDKARLAVDRKDIPTFAGLAGGIVGTAGTGIASAVGGSQAGMMIAPLVGAASGGVGAALGQAYAQTSKAVKGARATRKHRAALKASTKTRKLLAKQPERKALPSGHPYR